MPLEIWTVIRHPKNGRGGVLESRPRVDGRENSNISVTSFRACITKRSVAGKDGKWTKRRAGRYAGARTEIRVSKLNNESSRFR